MKCAIMQPTYFPWAGYFNLMAKVDYFVFLDDAQFQKGTWHNRNKFLSHGKEHWLTVPVLRKRLNQKICESLLDDSKNWRRKQALFLEQSYKHHPFYHEIEHVVEMLHDLDCHHLAKLNIEIIKKFASILNINTNFVLSSALNIDESRTSKLIRICNDLACDEYLSPCGAKDYLMEDGFTDLTDIALVFNQFDAKPYSQQGTKAYISHLSIFDVIANIGANEARKYIQHEEVVC